MKSKKIIIPSTVKELEAYYKLRFEVLRKPWGQVENSTRDEWENISIHVLMLDENEEAIAAGRLQLNPGNEGQIRSMAVKKEYRGLGLGSEILLFLEEKAKEKALTSIVLDARENAIPFYKKHGYVSTGPSYLLFNEIPHERMEKILKNKSER